jgi:proteasome accessory factor B
MPPLCLDSSEAAELMAAASVLDEAHGVPLLRGAREALTKVEAGLPLDVRTRATAEVSTTPIRLGPTSRHDDLDATYALVHRAIGRSEQLKCHYGVPGGATQEEFRLDPYWLLFYRHAWYVIGRSDAHGDMRPFKLSRLNGTARTGRTFDRPKGYTLDTYLGNAWGIVPGRESYDVRLRFSPVIGPYVAERNWHRTQRLAFEGDRHLLFRVTVDGLDEIAWWVHGFGAHVKVLEPEALNAWVAAIASSATGGPCIDFCDI